MGKIEVVQRCVCVCLFIRWLLVCVVMVTESRATRTRSRFRAAQPAGLLASLLVNPFCLMLHQLYKLVWNFSTVLVASNLFQMQKRYIFHFQIHWRCFLRVSSRWWCASVHMRFGSLVYVHLEPCVSTWFLELNTVHYERLFFWHSFQLLESLMICIRCHKTCAMLVDYNRDENHHLIRPVRHPTVGPDWLCGHALLFP